MTTRNYLYGCREPDNAAELLRIMDRANRYRNRLVEIELAKRERIREYTRELSPELAAAQDDCDAYESQIEAELAEQRLERQRARGAVDQAESVARVAAMRDALREARKREKGLRRYAYDTLRPGMDAITQDAYADIRAARKSYGLYWGTYLLVEQAAEDFGRGAPPRYQRFNGDGRLGVQVQNGITQEEIESGNDTRLRLMPRECHTGAAEHNRGRYREVWLRIGSDGRAPIWTRVPVIWHRDLPSGARIKWAVLQRRLVAGKPRWSLLLTIDVPDVTPSDLASGGACGIDIGYRVNLSGSQRVAVAVGDDGHVMPLRLPKGMLDQWRKCRDIRSIRDQGFDRAKAALLAWAEGRELPEWLDLSTLHAWRSSRRLSHLVYDWYVYRPRIDGDTDILHELWAWREREEHLHQYEDQLRDQLLARRKDMYRNYAAEIRRKYRTAYVERMDLRQAIHDTIRPEDQQETYSAQRAAAAFVCLSQLRECLRNSGVTVVEVEPAGTTTTCHACGRATEIRAATQVRYKCEHCRTTWDQDENAAHNILASGKVVSKSQESLASEAGQGVSGGKLKRKKISRSERNAAARKKRSEAAAAKRLP